jgi:hypothetical protein
VKLLIRLSDEFGDFLADGEKAAAFRFRRIDPFVQMHESIELDFDGIRNMNTSFANALIANLISQEPESVQKLHFSNCNPRIRVAIEAALCLGVDRLRERSSDCGHACH